MENKNVIVQLEDKLASVFEKLKRLPEYGQANATYIALYKTSSLFNLLKKIVIEMGYDADIVKNYGGRIHHVIFSEQERFVLIYAENETDFDWLYNYHSYSTSMIIGKILKNANLKYSDAGLEYVQYNLDPNHKSVIGTINITKSFYKILELLEFNTYTFWDGFKNLDEVFAFLVKTPYLKISKFIDLEKESNNIYLQLFQEYLILNKTEQAELKKIGLERLKLVFPEIDFDKEIQLLNEKAVNKKTLVDKFSGKVIINMIPDFPLKNIPIAMNMFRASFGNHENYVVFLMEHSSEQIIDKFKESIKILE